MVHDLENTLQDLDLAEKSAITNLHWDIDQYENADYYRLQEILNAKEVKDRVVDPLKFIKDLKK